MTMEPAAPVTATDSTSLASALVLRRLYVLFARAKRQEEIENGVWRAIVRLALLLSPALCIAGLAWFCWGAVISGYESAESFIAPRRFFVLQTGLNKDDSSIARRLYKEAVISRIAATGNGKISHHLRSLGRSGSVALSLLIRGDGTLERALILQSSGDKDLDGYACQIVRNTGPFPPLPPEVSQSGRLMMNPSLTFEYGNRAPEGLFPGQLAKEVLSRTRYDLPLYNSCPNN